MKTKEELEQYVKKCIESYYKGEPIINDYEYDKLIEQLEEVYPESDMLEKMEIQSDWNFPKETLPYKLYSIKKIKTLKDIQNWRIFISNLLGFKNLDFEVCITGKFDGQKILGLQVRNSYNFYTRGEDGIEAFNVSSRIKKCKLQNPLYSQEGELICSRENFQKYFKERYSSPRNLVPSVFSNENPIENLDKFDWICYSLYNSDLDKSEQIRICNQSNTYPVSYYICKISELTEDLLNSLFEKYSKDYILDGLVVDIEKAEYRNKLGATSKYLDCCRAYKSDSLNKDIKKSRIENITYQVSRYGKIAPVANITPVIINDGEVTNISLYNAKYILDNEIFVGQEILVERRGAINPKIYDILTKNKEKVNLPKYCPYCDSNLVWDDNHVDLFCENKNCKEIITQRIYFFLKTIGIKDFGLKSIRNIVYNTNLNTIEDFLNKDKFNFKIEGIGIKTIKQYFEKIDALKEKGIKIEVLQEASGCFEGISKDTFKILNSVNIDLEYYYKDSYYDTRLQDLKNLDGIGDKTAEAYMYGILLFFNFLEKIKKYINIEQKQQDSKNLNLSSYKVVFTGFRDENLKNYLEDNGGKVLSSMSSNCTHLIQKDKNSTSSKTEKAKSLGIEILSLEEFKKRLNLN